MRWQECMKIMGKNLKRKKNCVTHGAVPSSKISCNSVLSGRTGQSATESIPRAIGDPTYGILLLFTQHGGSNPYPTHPGQEYDS